MMLFKWFSNNHMKANISKSHLLVIKNDEIVINLSGDGVKNGEYE